MKDQMLKIAGVKSEKEFYKKFPTEEAFMAKHGGAFKKAAMGKSMVNKQLHQLTQWDNPEMAQMGVSAPLAFQDLLTGAKATNTGITKDEQIKQDAIQQISGTKKDSSVGIGNIMGDALTALTKGKGSGISSDIQGAIDSGFEMEYGGQLRQMQFGGGLTGIGNMISGAFDKKGGLGSGLVDMFGGNSQGVISGAKSGIAGGAAAAGMATLNAAPQILQGFDQVQQQKQNIAKADQAAQISGLTAQAANVRPEKKQRRYARPEDSLVQPGQMGSPTGTGTSYLQDGGEIQNTYAPNNIYTDLGFEPLEESLKQYRHGGHIQSAEFGDYFQDSGQASIGSGVGSALGSMFFGPIGGQVGSIVGKVAGNLLGGADDANKLARLQDQTKKNTEAAAWSAGAKSLQAQNASFMEYGGAMDKEHKWVSNGWQPQVITTFGEHKVSDLLKPPHDADMLRAGGHLKEYTPPSASAMFTGRPPLKPLTMDNGGRMTSTNMMFDTDKYPSAKYGLQFAMGGDLEVGDGGYLETISQNPNLPGGEVGMFRGASHDNGGIQTKYGDNHVEVEGGEPAVKLQDGGSSDNLVVFGNMKINKKIADLMGDPKAKDMKFKTYVADIAKNDKKQNKRIDKALQLIEDSDENSAFDHLSLNTGRAMLEGAKSWQKINAEKIKQAGIVQDAIHQTAKQLGVKSDRLAEGKLEQETDPSMVAKSGKKIKKAQVGTNEEKAKEAKGFWDPITHQYITDMYNPEGLDPITQEQIRRGIPVAAGLPGSGKANELAEVSVSSSKKPKIDYNNLEWPDLPGPFTKPEQGKKKFDWQDAALTALSYAPAFMRKTNANQPLPPDQIYPEMYALATNQLEPVQAQTYQPMLSTPYDVSFQDQLNAIDSQSRAAIRAAGQNPAAQAAIMAQTLEAKNKVLGEQNRINQATKMQVYDKNRDLINDAQLKNLQILDNQYVRQAQAKSNTRQQAIAALSSIAAKTAQQRASNKKLAILENLYGFRFSPSGVAYNVNQPAQFDMSGAGGAGRGSSYAALNNLLGKNKRITTDPVTGEVVGIRTLTKDEMAGGTPSLSELSNYLDDNQKYGGKTPKKNARNSSIVKALKNL